jgi:hypothetical protein
MMIRPADELGPVLAGRGLAAALRARVEASLKSEGSVVIDFAGVESMSPSFADELFAKLPAPHEERVKFEHLSDDLQSLVQFVIEGRSEPLE